MIRQLPDRANLDHLKKQAKELLAAIRAEQPEELSRFRSAFPQEPPTLVKAQLLLAREYGFPSWPALSRAVRDSGDVAGEFVEFALGGQVKKALGLWKSHRDALRANLAAAAVAGQVDVVRHLVGEKQELLNVNVGPKDRPLLTYVCFSRLMAAEKFAPGIRATAQALLELGSDPNGFFIGIWGGEEFRQTPLYGAAGVLNDPALTKLLLDAGGDPNDGCGDEAIYRGEAIYHACDFPGRNECLRLLLEGGASQAAKDYCIKRKLDFEDMDGVKVFLDSGANPNASYMRSALSHAILRGRSMDMLKLLLSRGADPNAKDQDGATAYILARRLGNVEAARLLEEHGAIAEFEPYDAILIAAAEEDEERVHELVTRYPEVVERFTDYGRQDETGLPLGSAGDLLHDMARLGKAKALRVLLDLGLDVGQRNRFGETPLHWAALAGQVDAVRLLLERGAPLDVKEKNHEADPLGWAIWGSTNWDDPRGSYAESVRLLLDAGALPEGRFEGSKEVQEVLHSRA
jgi:ankyrin repeat protein